LKPITTNKPADSNAVDDIIAYHDRTKHHPERYALGPGGLDWATQPNPFRRFAGSPVLNLPLADHDDTPAAATLFGTGIVPPRPFNLDSLGLFFELSMGLSARKEFSGMSWYLRMNPSSGNLHPTEAYAVLPVLEWLPDGAGVYHYAPLVHALEQRAHRSSGARPDAAGFFVGLTSITWREAWKYGERAFRYCQHDVGHAFAALRYATAALGWRIELLPEWTDAQLARLLGLDRAEDFAGAECETPELLVRVLVNEAPEPAPLPIADAQVEWFGRANALSRSHVAWPVIDEAIAVTERKTPMAGKSVVPVAWSPPALLACALSSGQLIHQRRSAVDFDGVTSLTREKFLAILDATLPRASAPPFDAWPFPARLHLVLFVHRVTGLEPGRGNLAECFSRRAGLGSPGGPGHYGAALASGPWRPARFRADRVLPAGHCRRRRIQPRHAGAIRTSFARTRRAGLARVVLGIWNNRTGALSGRRGRRCAGHGHWLLFR
jgi:SagB-type dehydrogenase family enzyme